MQASIANARDSLRAGMSFEVTMTFPGDTYPAVSPLAIQWGADGAFIWAVADGKAKRVPVRIIQRNTENVLVDAEIETGDAGRDRRHPECARWRRCADRRRQSARADAGGS